MNLTTFVTASIALTIQKYADKYREKDLNLTLQELEEDMSLPNIKSFDFIVGTYVHAYICSDNDLVYVSWFLHILCSGWWCSGMSVGGTVIRTFYRPSSR